LHAPAPTPAPAQGERGCQGYKSVEAVATELRSRAEADRYLTLGRQPLPSPTSAGGELTNIITTTSSSIRLYARARGDCMRWAWEGGPPDDAIYEDTWSVSNPPPKKDVHEMDTMYI